MPRYWYRSNLTPFDGVANTYPNDDAKASLLIVEVGNMLFGMLANANIYIDTTIKNYEYVKLDWNVGLTLPVKQLPIGTKYIASDTSSVGDVRTTATIQLASDGSVHVITQSILTSDATSTSRGQANLNFSSLPGVIVDAVSQ